MNKNVAILFSHRFLASSTYALIGGVVGGAVGAILVIFIVVLVLRRKRSKVNHVRAVAQTQPVALPAAPPSTQQYNSSTLTSIKPIWSLSEYDVEPRSKRTDTVWSNERPTLRSSMYIPPVGSKDYGINERTDTNA